MVQSNLPFFNIRTLNRFGAMRRFRNRGFGSTRYSSGNRTMGANDPRPNQNHGVLTSRGFVGRYNSLRERGFYDGGLPDNGKDFNRMQSIVGAKNITASYKIWKTYQDQLIPNPDLVYKYKLFATPLAPTPATQPINRTGSSSFLRNTQLRITVLNYISRRTSAQMAHEQRTFNSYSFRVLIAQVFLPRGTEPDIDFVLTQKSDVGNRSASYFAPYNYENNGRFKIWYDRHIDFPPRYTTCPGTPTSAEVGSCVICPRSVYMGVSIDFNSKVDYIDGTANAINDIESNGFYMWVIPRCGTDNFIPNVQLKCTEVSLFYDF